MIDPEKYEGSLLLIFPVPLGKAAECQVVDPKSAKVTVYTSEIIRDKEDFIQFYNSCTLIANQQGKQEKWIVPQPFPVCYYYPGDIRDKLTADSTYVYLLRTFTPLQVGLMSLDKLAEKEKMSRREFIKALGLSIMAILGTAVGSDKLADYLYGDEIRELEEEVMEDDLVKKAYRSKGIEGVLEEAKIFYEGRNLVLRIFDRKIYDELVAYLSQSPKYYALAFPLTKCEIELYCERKKVICEASQKLPKPLNSKDNSSPKKPGPYDFESL